MYHHDPGDVGSTGSVVKCHLQHPPPHPHRTNSWPRQAGCCIAHTAMSHATPLAVIVCTKFGYSRRTSRGSLSTVSEGFVADPWLSITSTLCHILHLVSHWLVLDLSAWWYWQYDIHLTLASSLCVGLAHFPTCAAARAASPLPLG
jgi:hypothetical protein